MPAAAVILVPIVCMMIDAVKKSVVYFIISIVRYTVWLGERWNVITLTGWTEAKAVYLNVLLEQGRKLEDRRWLDTIVVLAVNYVES